MFDIPKKVGTFQIAQVKLTNHTTRKNKESGKETERPGGGGGDLKGTTAVRAVMKD